MISRKEYGRFWSFTNLDPLHATQLGDWEILIFVKSQCGLCQRCFEISRPISDAVLYLKQDKFVLDRCK